MASSLGIYSRDKQGLQAFLLDHTVGQGTTAVGTVAAIVHLAGYSNNALYTCLALFSRSNSIDITSSYGERGGGFHYGIDLGNELGGNVYSPEYGVITAKGTLRDGNNFIQIRGSRSGHYLGFYHTDTSLLNLSLGDSVRAGQVIGRTDLSGRTRGPHLHFTTQTGPGLGRDTRYNPIQYFQQYFPNLDINYRY